ncbi:hypothetical protein DSL72_003025 [Monilinia vaccinii-corymbosi]|uniref:Uncharacterized protein n=1 Tax=Monilinia vaccinii-corymbosi TaxID=61207 RepID=A0A8A3P8M6_9HELO|nr:hypothetical protein DSL72_003025 [Monilinia vaccinii-corymbosi]
MREARSRRVRRQGIVAGGQKAKEEDQGQEEDDGRHVGAHARAQEDEADDGHDHGVIALAGIVCGAQGAGDRHAVEGGGVGAGDVVEGIVEEAEVGHVHAEDDEGGKGERVAEDELADAGDDHGDAAVHVEGARGGEEGLGRGTLEVEEREDGAAEGDEEAEESEEGWVPWGH